MGAGHSVTALYEIEWNNPNNVMVSNQKAKQCSCKKMIYKNEMDKVLTKMNLHY